MTDSQPDGASTSSISTHTLETLCDELVSGRPVTTDDGGATYLLSARDSRSAMQWLVQNKTKWAQNNTKQDVELLVDAIDHAPRHTTPPPPRQAGQAKLWKLCTVRAHCFAGLCTFEDTPSSPSDFVVSFGGGATIIQGDNGAGKSSILNAITWCLTGIVTKPQRPPERAVSSMPIATVSLTDTTEDTVQTSRFEIPVVVPIPAATTLSSQLGGHVTFQTWVELELEDVNSHTTLTIRREIGRTLGGRVEERPPSNLALLGIDPLALLVGTTMPALIPHIRLGDASDLGKGVATLTGLSPLADMCKYVTKSIQKLGSDLVRDRQSEIEELDTEYRSVYQTLNAIIQENAGIAQLDSISQDPSSATFEQIDGLASKWLSQYSQLFGEAVQILGQGFDPADSTATSEIAANAGPALGALERQQLRALTSMQRLVRLSTLDETCLRSVDQTLSTIADEAAELVEIERNPIAAQRVRLYARVGQWLKEEVVDSEPCPICARSLDGILDPVLGLAIRDQLYLSSRQASAFRANTISAWGSQIKDRLIAVLGTPNAVELDIDMPAMPSDLLRQGLTVEVFTMPRFRGVLGLLRRATEEQFDRVAANLPAFTEPTLSSLPESVVHLVPQVALWSQRASRLAAFARWKRVNSEQWNTLLDNVLGPDQYVPEQHGESLRGRVRALDNLARRGGPLRSAQASLRRLRDLLTRCNDKLARLSKYQKTFIALQPLLGLRELVNAQVSSLMERLRTSTSDWKRRFYTPAFVNAPITSAAGVTNDGRLQMESALSGTFAQAQHVANTSDLRATLLAFLVALWEETALRRGGLQMLLLDDVHDHFDGSNEARFARSLPIISAAKAQVILTTNRDRFRRRVSEAFQAAENTVESLAIHPRNPQRPTIRLAHFVETVEQKRRLFEDPLNVNVAQPAREYVNELRIYLEENALDFFDTSDPQIGAAPTLADLIGGLRRRITSGVPPFTERPFATLVSDIAMQQRADFLRIMNESHHSSASTLSYGEIHAVKADCRRVTSLIHAAHETYERWLRQEQSDSPLALPSLPEKINVMAREVPLYGITALVSGLVHNEPDQSGETLTLDGLSHHAQYFVRCHNLGFSAPEGSAVLVDLNESELHDGQLVIALYQSHVYARRLLLHSNHRGFITLASEAADPRSRPPTIILPKSETRLLPVRGVMFSPALPLGRSVGEAVHVQDDRAIARSAIAFRVEGDSALPLALSGQTILGSRPLGREELVPGKLIAASVTSGGAFFKRVGAALPGMPNLRLLESIGGLGNSLVVRLDESDSKAAGGIPLLRTAISIEGVLY